MRALATLILLALAMPATAQSWYQSPRPGETLEDQRRRHDANRYMQDRQSGGQPLGGYRERLGDARPYPNAWEQRREDQQRYGSQRRSFDPLGR